MIVEVGECEFPVVGHGEQAERLARCKTGQPVRVEGCLVLHRWCTCDGRSNIETAIEAESVGEP